MVPSFTKSLVIFFSVAPLFAPIKGAPTPRLLFGRHQARDDGTLTSTSASASASTSVNFQKQNGIDAQKLNAGFANLKASDACDEGTQACVESSFAQCVGGKWILSPCSGNTVCLALPLVNKAGTSITCDTVGDAAARFAAAGVDGGVVGDGSVPSPSAPAPSASATADSNNPELECDDDDDDDDGTPQTAASTGAGNDDEGGELECDDDDATSSAPAASASLLGSASSSATPALITPAVKVAATNFPNSPSSTKAPSTIIKLDRRQIFGSVVISPAPQSPPPVTPAATATPESSSAFTVPSLGPQLASQPPPVSFSAPSESVPIQPSIAPLAAASAPAAAAPSALSAATPSSLPAAVVVAAPATVTVTVQSTVTVTVAATSSGAAIAPPPPPFAVAPAQSRSSASIPASSALSPVPAGASPFAPPSPPLPAAVAASPAAQPAITLTPALRPASSAAAGRFSFSSPVANVNLGVTSPPAAFPTDPADIARLLTATL